MTTMTFLGLTQLIQRVAYQWCAELKEVKLQSFLNLALDWLSAYFTNCEIISYT
jgi:hypothetical protein